MYFVDKKKKIMKSHKLSFIRGQRGVGQHLPAAQEAEADGVLCGHQGHPGRGLFSGGAVV